MMRRIGWLAATGLLALSLQGCGTAPSSSNTAPAGNTAPAITSFTGTSITGGAAYHWTVSDADSDTLTCALDTNNDGTADVYVPDCGTNTSQSYAFSSPGSYTSKLTVSDGHGHSTSTTTPTIAAGTSATPATWATQFGTSVDDVGSGITSDGNGNTTLVGYTYGALPGHISAGGSDIVIAKYDPDGNQLWATQFGGSGNDYGSGIASDATGNTTITGTTYGDLPGHTSAGGADIVIAKYDPDGNQLWATQFGGSGGDGGSGITSDGNGNTTLVGNTYGDLPGHTNAGGTDIVIAKYDPDGNQLWATQFGGSGNDAGSGITSDATGNTTLVGYTYGALPGHISAGGSDIVIAKYDPDGNQLWATQFGGSGNDYGYGVASDANGDTTLVGYAGGALPGHTSAGGYDIVIAKYDPDGNQLWATQFGGSGNDIGRGIASDGNGNTIITGNTGGALPGHTSAGGNDIVIAKYDPDGDQVWARQLGGSGGDYGSGVASEANGDTTLVGYTGGALPGHTSAGGYDIVTAKYLP